MKEKIIFLGAGPYVNPILETLKEKFEIVLAISSREKIGDELINELRSSGARVAVLASFGQIIPPKMLDLFECGIINIHPSLLPEYRGPTPVQTAILNGDRVSGVSIIKLDAEVDHGPILAQEKVNIGDNDTGESLYNKLFGLGAELICEVLPKYISGEIKPSDQNHSNATFTKPLSRASGEIKLSDPPDKTYLDRLIRAYHPWPGVWFRTNLNGKEKTIKLLPENIMQVEGKNAMGVKDFANGYPEANAILTALNLNE